MTTPSTTDPTSGSQNDHDDEASTAPTKPVRRRATRTISSPTKAAAPIVIRSEPAAGTTSNTTPPAPSVNVITGTGGMKRSRRATKAAGAAEQSAPAPRTATDDAPSGAPAAERTSTKDTTPRTDEAPAPDTSRDASTTGTGQDTAAEPKAAAPRKRATRRRAAAPPAAPADTAAADTAPADTVSATETSAPEAAGSTAPSATTRAAGAATGRGTRTRSDAASSDRGADRPRSAPRLATTALVFQAPNLSTPRRARTEPELTMAGVGQEPTPPRAEPAPRAAAQEDSPRDTTGGDGPGRSGRTGAGAAPVPTFQAATLSEDDAAAADEVGVIEEELSAEGVELTELAPADLTEDEDVEHVEDDEARANRRRRRRGGRGRRGGRTRDSRQGDADEDESDQTDSDGNDVDTHDDDSGTDEDHTANNGTHDTDGDTEGDLSGSRRRRRRRRGSRAERAEAARSRGSSDEVTALKGSTRLEAKKQRRREGRDAGRRRQIVSEAEFLARRESVTRSMVVREQDGRTQIAVLEDDVLVEHYVSQQSQVSMAGNVYLGRVQNVLPSMEAAFVDIGKGRNAVLYAGEVNWDAAGIADGQPRRIEEALKSGDTVLVQVTKDPIGHKGARLTSQVTLAGRYLVFVPGGGMTGISRKLPDTERSRLKKILRDVVPDGAGVIVRTAAEGASEDELRADVDRLQGQWDAINTKAEKSRKSAPVLLQGEPDLAIRVVRDIFNDDFSSLIVAGGQAWEEISSYVDELAPDLRDRVTRWTQTGDVFAAHRVDEQLAKGMDRKVWLPSGGSLVIDRTEAMTVVDVNTGKFTGAGGTLEETVTRNNLEAAEEIVRQLRLRDIGGIIVIDFIDMVLESNRDLVLRRLVECLGRDRTKHQVAEVTSLGLVQMTRKRVGQGLVEAFSVTCEHCNGRGFVVHDHPIERGPSGADQADNSAGARKRRKRSAKGESGAGATGTKEQSSGRSTSNSAPVLPEESSEERAEVKARLATIAAAAQHAHEDETTTHEAKGSDAGATAEAASAGPDDTTGSGTGAAPSATEPKLDLPLPEPRSGSGRRATSSGAASLDTIVLPDRSARSDRSDSVDDEKSEDAGDAADRPDESNAVERTEPPEPPKGAGDEVA